MPREIFFRGSLTADLSLQGDLPPRSKPKQPKPRETCRVCKGTKRLAGTIDGQPGSIPCPFCRRNKGRVRRYGTRAMVAVMKARAK